MSDKLKIITTVSSWPAAIEAQRRSLDKFCENKFRFIAVVDTPVAESPWNLWNKGLRKAAIEKAREFCDHVILMPEELHNNRKVLFPNTKVNSAKYSNERAADTLQYAYNLEIVDSNDTCLILDSDMFPVREFNVQKDLNEKSIRGVHQTRKAKFRSRVNYLWNGILQLQPNLMEFGDQFSFDCGRINGAKVDTGGHTHYWLKEISKLGLKSTVGQIDHYPSLNWDISLAKNYLSGPLLNFVLTDDRNSLISPYVEVYDEKFLHFRAGSNWNAENSEIVVKRQKAFIDALLISL